MLDHAIALARRGFRVFPLIANGKTPAIEHWPVLATTDEPQIRRWWSPNPVTGEPDEKNIGVATGDDWLVIDVDLKKGDEAQRSFDQLDMMGLDVDAATRSMTASGGLHIWLRVPDGVPPPRNRVGLLPGIDVRGWHGFVVAPGSVVNGAAYRWSNDAPPEEPIEAPDWLLEMIGTAPARRKGGAEALAELDSDVAVERARLWLEEAEGAVEGAGGDAATVQVAMRLGDMGVSAERALELLTEEGGWNERCSPPWDVNDLQRKVENGYRYRASALGSALPEVAAAELGLDEDATAEDLRAAVAALMAPPAVASKSGAESTFWFGHEDALDLVSQPSLVKGWIDQHALAVMYGDSNAGKTFIALDMAYHIATGRAWNGCKVEQGAVLYLALEGGRNIRKRMKAWALHHQATHEGLPFAVVPQSLNLLRGAEDLKKVIDAAAQVAARYGRKVVLIVVDTLARALAGGDENSSVDMGAMVKQADRMREHTGAAVLIVHHSGKDKARGARGHSSLRAATDTEIEVESGQVCVTKQRDMDRATPLRFSLKDVDLGLVVDGEPMKSAVPIYGASDFVVVPLTPAEQEAVDSLALYAREVADEEEKSLAEIKLELAIIEKLLGKKRQNAQKLMAALVTKGAVRKTQRGQWVII